MAPAYITSQLLLTGDCPGDYSGAVTSQRSNAGDGITGARPWTCWTIGSITRSCRPRTGCGSGAPAACIGCPGHDAPVPAPPEGALMSRTTWMGSLGAARTLLLRFEGDDGSVRYELVPLFGPNPPVRPRRRATAGRAPGSERPGR